MEKTTKKTKKAVSKPATKKVVKKVVQQAPITMPKPAVKAMPTKKCGALSPLRLGVAMGIIFAVSALIIHFYPIILGQYFDFMPPKGSSLKFVMNDIYPGYNQGLEVTGVLIALAYAFVDGFLFALVLAWLYNLLSIKK